MTTDPTPRHTAQDDLKVLFLGAEFLRPLWAPDIAVPVAIDLCQPLEAQLAPHADAHFAYAMNTAPARVPALHAARDRCRQLGIPTVWHTIEDPNSFGAFVAQAEGFDLVCTSDGVCVPDYARRYPGATVRWVPLAAQPAIHVPRPVAPDAADFVLIANWYTNDARRTGVATVVDPVLEAGYTLHLYAYAQPAWPARYRRVWRGATSYLEVARWYPTGRVALGLNNQARGTQMTSMRTFEALACGKPMIAASSEAYAALGFRDAVHFVWSRSREETLDAAFQLLRHPEGAAAMAARGRDEVLAHHTYRHRLQTIREALGV